jgi:hypothetical protein
MKVKEELNLSVIPFESEIVGADKKYVYIKETLEFEKELCCALKIKRKDYLTMCNMWLDRKSDFCLRYGHFCGVFGNIFISKYKEDGKINLLVGFDEEKEDVIYKEVPVFEVIEFDNCVDIEHG